tara:strand:- start:327 stop:1001 length:675 start_codon:yes stop_codon:yes gene_type:complete
MKNKKILVLVAHADDEIIGCGGTLAKLSKNNKIMCVFYSDGETSRITSNTSDILKRKKNALKVSNSLNINKPMFLNFKDNQLDTYPLLEIIKETEKIINKFKPDIIFTHFDGDLNIDHQIVSRAVKTAIRPVLNKNIEKLYMMEILSSTNLMLNKNDAFYPNTYIDITQSIKVKEKCLKIYKDEMMIYPKIRSIHSIINLNAYRGSEISSKFCESFILVREIIN